MFALTPPPGLPDLRVTGAIQPRVRSTKDGDTVEYLVPSLAEAQSFLARGWSLATPEDEAAFRAAAHKVVEDSAAVTIDDSQPDLQAQGGEEDED